MSFLPKVTMRLAGERFVMQDVDAVELFLSAHATSS